jgi:hypothetical protein
MKKLFTAAIVALAITTTAFAADITKVNFQTLQNFKNTFVDAEDVQWSVRNDYAKASFIDDGDKMEAYFDLSGDLIGTSRAITTQVLPKAARKHINKKYSDYTWKEVIEFKGKDSEHYFVSLNNNKENVILQISKEGDVSVFKSTKK